MEDRPTKPDAGSLRITVNGESAEYPAPLDTAGLIERLGLTGRRVAVEVNGEIVPRSRHRDHRLQDGDRVEVIHAVGGG